MKKEKCEISPFQVHLRDRYGVNPQESCAIIGGYSEKIAEQAAILNSGLKNKDYLGLSISLGENSEIADNIVTNKEYFFKLADSYGIELTLKLMGGEISHDILEKMSKNEEISFDKDLLREIGEDDLTDMISQYLLDRSEDSKGKKVFAGENIFMEMFKPFTKGYNFTQDKDKSYRARVTDSAHHDEHTATRSLDKA